MAQYYKVDVVLNSQAVTVGLPSPQSVSVTLPLVGPAGPQGERGEQGPPGDVAGLPLTTQGDTLYRGASANERLPIGTFGQILKVSAGGVPEWGEAPATGVTSVTGTAPIVSSGGTAPAISINAATTLAAGSMSSADKTKLDGIAAGAEVNVNADWNASSGDAQILNKPTLGSAAAAATTDFAAASHSHTLADITNAGTAAGVDADQNLGTGDSVKFATLGINGTPEDGRSFHQRGGKFLVETGSGSYGVFQLLSSDIESSFAVATEAEAVASGDGNGSSDMFVPSDDQLWVFGLGAWTGAQNKFSFGNLANGAVLQIDVDGALGVGKTEPEAKLDVAGAIQLADPEDSTKKVLLDASTLDTETTVTLNPPAVSGTLVVASELGTAATADSTDFAAATHTHAASDITSGSFGNISHDGKVGSTSGLPLVTTTAGAVTTLALGTANQVLRVNSGATAVEFADPAAGGVSAVGSTVADILSVSGSDLVADDLGADKLYGWDDSEGKAIGFTIGSGLSVSGDTLSATGGGVTGVDTTTADVLSVSGSDLVADDGGTIDSADPFIKWDDVAGKLVYANPLSRPSGAFYVGLAPTTTALGTDAFAVKPSRSSAADTASGNFSVCIGPRACRASGANSVAIGDATVASGSGTLAIGYGALAAGGYAIGGAANASGARGVALGSSTASAVDSASVGEGATANLRGMFATRPFNAIYWGGQTTNDTATILNLDATATNRFTIAANTALAVDILLVARRSDVADKWLVARRFLGIRRDGSNNTSLIGSVQTLGTDQTAGSPTWSFTLTADDTNEALQLEVTGAASETVQWRATAFYRVV